MITTTSRSIVSRSIKTPTIHTKPVRSYPIGINHNFTSFMSVSTLKNSYLGLLIKAGIKWVRFEMIMADQQNTQGVFTFESGSAYNSKVTAFRNAGIEVIALMDQYGMPSWASPSGSFYPPSPSVYGTWCQHAAANWVNQIRFYEMGNEPNYKTFWQPQENISQYVALLEAGYAGIKAGDSKAKVISGGLGSAINAPTDWTPTIDFLEGMLQAGAQDYFDYLGMHVYADSTTDSNYSTITGKIDDLRDMQLSYNDTTPWFITEIGWPTQTGGMSEATQAANFASLFDDILNNPTYSFIKVVTPHNFRESTDPTNPEHNYGIVNYPNLDPKPAFQSFIDAKNDFESNYRILEIG